MLEDKKTGELKDEELEKVNGGYYHNDKTGTYSFNEGDLFKYDIHSYSVIGNYDNLTINDTVTVFHMSNDMSGFGVLETIEMPVSALVSCNYIKK